MLIQTSIVAYCLAIIFFLQLERTISTTSIVVGLFAAGGVDAVGERAAVLHGGRHPRDRKSGLPGEFACLRACVLLVFLRILLGAKAANELPFFLDSKVVLNC